MHNDVFRVSGLGLVLDHSRHQVTRQGCSPVDLGGNCRLWAILTELCKRHNAYLLKKDLISAVWGYGVIPEEVTVYAAMSELRRRLRPLGLTIKHTKGLGYRLEDLACCPGHTP